MTEILVQTANGVNSLRTVLGEEVVTALLSMLLKYGRSSDGEVKPLPHPTSLWHTGGVDWGFSAVTSWDSPSVHNGPTTEHPAVTAHRLSDYLGSADPGPRGLQQVEGRARVAEECNNIDLLPSGLLE
jgi:hypothetical protein